MPDQTLTIRILTLVSLLNRETYWSPDRLAKRFDTTRRTIYRYFDDIKKMGYTLVKDDQHRC